MPASASDLLCRVLMYYSLAFLGNNTATIEFSTPANTAVSNIVLCSLDADQRFQSNRVQLLSVIEGGSIFTTNEVRRVPGATLSDESTFLNGVTREHAVELLKPADILGDDPFYASQNSSWGSAADVYWPLWLLRLPTNVTTNVTTATAPNTTLNSSSNSTTATSSSSSSSSPAFNSSTSSIFNSSQVSAQQCIRISARWRAFTRYQISLRFNNRPPPRDNTTTVRPLQLWVAGAIERDAKGTGFVVRGSKAGTTCSLRPAVARNFTQMFDACAQAQADGLLPPRRVPTVQSCIRLLQLRRANASVPLPFPYTTVPVAPISITDFNDTGLPGTNTSGAALLSSSNSSVNSSSGSGLDAVESWDDHSYTDDLLDLAPADEATDSNITANGTMPAVNATSGDRRLQQQQQQQQGMPMECTPARDARRLQQALNSSSYCPAGYALGPRLGGECIQCGNGAVQDNVCQCFPGYAVLPSGPLACGDPISTIGNVSNAAQLAGLLCSTYSAHEQAMMKGRLADRVVQGFYLSAFMQQAAFILDQRLVSKANDTFWDQLVTDERNPDSPTRRTGIGPNCNRCQQGLFTDVYTGNQLPVRDDRFRAMQTFRLMGYLLNSAGFPCPALWDPANPLEWKYGTYHRKICMVYLEDPGSGSTEDL